MQTFAVSDIFENLSSAFTSAVGILTGNPITIVIIAAAVGIPILGAIMALFGRRG